MYAARCKRVCSAKKLSIAPRTTPGSMLDWILIFYKIILTSYESFVCSFSFWRRQRKIPDVFIRYQIYGLHVNYIVIIGCFFKKNGSNQRVIMRMRARYSAFHEQKILSLPLWRTAAVPAQDARYQPVCPFPPQRDKRALFELPGAWGFRAACAHADSYCRCSRNTARRTFCPLCRTSACAGADGNRGRKPASTALNNILLRKKREEPLWFLPFVYCPLPGNGGMPEQDGRRRSLHLGIERFGDGPQTCGQGKILLRFILILLSH